MINKSASLKVSLRFLQLIIFSSLLLSILISELLYYSGITAVPLISGINKTLIYLLMLITALFCASKKKSYPRVLKIFLLFSIWTVISTLLGIDQDISKMRQIIQISCFAATLYIFYIVSLKEPNRVTTLLKCMYLIILIIYFKYNIFESRINQNSIYYLVMFLPITSLFCRKSTRIILFILQFIAILLSIKRTAFLGFLIYCIFLFLGQSNSSKKVWKYCALVILSIILYFIYPTLVQKIMVLSDLSLNSIQVDGGSNRIYVYSQFWKVQSSSNLIHWLFGDGYNSVLLSRICTDGINGSWVSAHSDYLEILYDYGLIGSLLYILFYIELFRSSKLTTYQLTSSNAFKASIFLSLMISLFSHLILYLNYYCILFAYWGLCLAQLKSQETIKNENILRINNEERLNFSNCPDI